MGYSGALSLPFFSPKFYTVVGRLCYLRPRDSPCPRSSFVHLSNKHSLGAYHEPAILGTRAVGMNTTQSLPSRAAV